MLKNKDKFNH